MVTRVGQKYNGKTFRYPQCKADLHGWVSCQEYLPHEYDLLEIKNHQGIVKTGWYTGCIWDGCKIEENEKFLFWRKKKELVP